MVFTARHKGAHRSAGRHGDRLHRLVAGDGHDGVVARVHELLHRPEQRLLGAGEGEHVVGIDLLVRTGDRLPQTWRAPRLDVGQRQPHEALAVGFRAKGQQFCDGHALSV